MSAVPVAGEPDPQRDPRGPIRVVLAEDHALVREGTRRILEATGPIQVVGEAADGEEAVSAVERHHPHVAIVDIGMPRLNGIEATRRIKATCPHVGVLVLTVHEDDQYVFALLEAGAAGYLLKDVDGPQLVQAVEAVYAGESVLHPAITRKVLLRIGGRDDAGASHTGEEVLSDREHEVLGLAARGMANKEIGAALGVSVRTVEAHLSAVFHKLNVGSRTEAVLYGLRQGWFPLDEPQSPS
jgi:two-component system, NarL family, response regulator LiaR